MTDSSADPSTSPASDGLDMVVDTLRSQVEEIVGLDAARAEAWASDVLAWTVDVVDLADPVAALADALRRVDADWSATARAALRPFIGDEDALSWSGPRPEWTIAVGTSRCEGAWLLDSRGAQSAAFRFVDAADVRHVLTVDLDAGSPETVGEVIVGPGDLLGALDEEDADVAITPARAGDLAARVVIALRNTEAPHESAVVNGRLLLLRLAALTDEAADAPAAVVESVPEPPVRDPEDDAFALEVLARALPAARSTPDAAETPAAAAAVAAVAAVVAPVDLEPYDPAARDAIVLLEWADWLGAVIGLVRAGAGTVVDGSALVDFINRCPEVDSPIPKADRARIAWAFDTLFADWDEHGLLDDGRLTTTGVAVLPEALRRAWTRTAETGSASVEE